MIYRKVISHQAEKFIRKQPVQVQQRIIRGIRELPIDGDIKKLKGSIYYRLRIGSMRIVYEIIHTEKVICIRTIDNRGDIY